MKNKSNKNIKNGSGEINIKNESKKHSNKRKFKDIVIKESEKWHC